MKNLLKIFVVAAVVVLVLSVPSSASAMTCVVNEPISASDLNAGGTWSFDVFGGTPSGTYNVKVQWAGDPSNGGHPSTTVGPLDSTGFARKTLPAKWAPDGFLPGSTVNGVFTAVPGEFQVKVYSAERTAKGRANCNGVVD